jgi:hypothetical protein
MSLVQLHHLLAGPSDLSVQVRSSDSAPSEARKRGSGGGSPRKYDDLLTGPSLGMPSLVEFDHCFVVDFLLGPRMTLSIGTWIMLSIARFPDGVPHTMAPRKKALNLLRFLIIGSEDNQTNSNNQCLLVYLTMQNEDDDGSSQADPEV